MYFPRMTLSFTASSTTATQPIILGGPGQKDINWEVEVFDMIIRIPDWTNAITTTISLINQDGLTIYSIAGLTDPQLTPPCYIQLARKIKQGSSITVTLSGVSGNIGDVTIDLGGTIKT